MLTDLPDFDISFTEYTLAANDELGDLIKDEVIEEAETALEEGLTAVFEQNGYKMEDIAIHINSEEETTQITIVIPQDEQQQIPQMEQLVLNETGILPKILCQS